MTPTRTSQELVNAAIKKGNKKNMNKFNRTQNWLEGGGFLSEEEKWDNHPDTCSILTCEYC